MASPVVAAGIEERFDVIRKGVDPGQIGALSEIAAVAG
jgi:hypothetical protein